MGKGAKKGRHRTECPTCGAARTGRDAAPADEPPAPKEKGPKVPLHLAAYAHAAPLTGAKKIKKQCCRSSPRCKGCPVLLMRAARLQESGVTGKDLKKALKKARAA
ncbi:hypothetical protein [Actinomycetospora sp. CA-053990]|uniref:hypothetical protein n=1 Tax=Actinomycetospora sp. CA-053990 TaxID=3239891 RepID=UPI003D943813